MSEPAGTDEMIARMRAVLEIERERTAWLSNFQWMVEGYLSHAQIQELIKESRAEVRELARIEERIQTAEDIHKDLASLAENDSATFNKIMAILRYSRDPEIMLQPLRGVWRDGAFITPAAELAEPEQMSEDDG